MLLVLLCSSRTLSCEIWESPRERQKKGYLGRQEGKRKTDVYDKRTRNEEGFIFEDLELNRKLQLLYDVSWIQLGSQKFVAMVLPIISPLSHYRTDPTRSTCPEHVFGSFLKHSRNPYVFSESSIAHPHPPTAHIQRMPRCPRGTSCD